MKQSRIITLAALFLSVSTASASTPYLASITPRGGQRGQEMTILFNGARLADAQEIMVYYPGVSVSKLEAVNDSQSKATIKIAADCRLGEHGFRVRTASGISEFMTFYVGALANVDEKEPNSEFKTPQKINLNVTVNGVVNTEDVDYFLVEAKKGQRLTAEIEGMRLANTAGTVFDPYIAILDMKRFELAASDDSPLGGQDGIASIIVPADGTYVVQVRETSYGGDANCMYRLHVGTFPRPTAVLPAGGKRGEEIEATFLGDSSGPFKQKIKLPATNDPNFGLFAQDANGVAPSPLPFRLSEYGNVLEAEPNDDLAHATKAALPIALNGVIGKQGDMDFYRFAAKKGQSFDVHCYARRIRSPLDPVVYICNPDGNAILAADDAIGPDSYLRFNVPEDKEYLLMVFDHLKKGGPDYSYRIEFTPVQPKLTLTIPKVDIFGYSQERQTIPVPRGNRYACLVNAARADFGGPLTLGADGLPKGMTMQCEGMAPNLDIVPVVFEAAADAPVGGALAKLNAKHADPAQKISGGFDQSVILVGVGNVGVFWKHHVDRAAVAVTEEVPFKINVVEPKAPLVQNGSMNLKVVAERKSGFKAAIAVYPLFNPPGVGAGAVTIPEGQNEAYMPMNATGDAQVRKWKTAVIAQSDYGKGPVWTSSQLFTLDIAQPFVTFAMERSAVEQGKETDLFCKIQHNAAFAGNAKVNLIGLPHQATTAEMQISKDTKEFAFKVKTTAASPAGQHKNLFCQVVVTHNGEPVVHNVGYSELRIDAPPPMPVAAAPAPAAAAPQPAPAAPPAEKRLTRLEKLRLEQKEREKRAAK